MGYHQTSTEPILRIMDNPNEKIEKENDSDSSSSSSSLDDNLFVEFDSSDDGEIAAKGYGMDVNAKSLVRKSKNIRKNKPLIEEISSVEFDKISNC